YERRNLESRRARRRAAFLPAAHGWVLDPRLSGHGAHGRPAVEVVGRRRREHVQARGLRRGAGHRLVPALPRLARRSYEAGGAGLRAAWRVGGRRADPGVPVVSARRRRLRAAPGPSSGGRDRNRRAGGGGGGGGKAGSGGARAGRVARRGRTRYTVGIPAWS